MKPDESGISTNQTAIHATYRANHPSRQVEQQTHHKTETPVEKTQEPAVLTPSAERILYNKIQGANTTAYEVIEEIRAVDDTMQQIGQKLDGMKRALETILKNYPPFPTGSN